MKLEECKGLQGEPLSINPEHVTFIGPANFQTADGGACLLVHFSSGESVVIVAKHNPLTDKPPASWSVEQADM